MEKGKHEYCSSEYARVRAHTHIHQHTHTRTHTSAKDGFAAEEQPACKKSSYVTKKPRSPTLQTDSLPAEPQGKPKNTGVGSLSLLQGIFPTQGLNPGLLHCRQILYQLSLPRKPQVCHSFPSNESFNFTEHQ